MNISFLSNHIFPFHVGGSEMVIKNISEELSTMNHNVSVYGWDVTESISQNNVKINRYTLEKASSILEDSDVIIVYSDAFLKLNHIIKLNEKYKKKIILFPVGFTGSVSDSLLSSLVFNERSNLIFVCHDESYLDALMLKERNIKYSIIPNGINENEFFAQREIFEISDKINVLCVANTFPKKGHIELMRVCEMVNSIKPVELNIHCHTPAWNVGKRLQSQLINFSKKMPYKVNFLVDKKRSDVISSFYKNDIFLLCSLKEVAPICIIESCASGLPWCSFDVGNVSNIPGGIVNDINKNKLNGYLHPSDEMLKEQSNIVISLLSKSLRSKLSIEGLEFAKKITWKKIANQYNEVINS